MNSFDNQFNPNQNVLSPEMEREIAGAYPWMRFVSIFMFVLLGIFTLIVGLAAIVASAAGGVEALIGLLVYLVLMTVIFFFPLLFLLQSGSAFKNYLATKDISQLITALTKQKAHWRYVCILLIIYLVLTIIGYITLFALGANFMRGFGDFF